MTVITKPLSDKKLDKLDQPLVSSECLPHIDVEGGQLEGQQARLLILQARARRASSVTTACLLLMALLVMCCGVLGGVYLYKQYAYTQYGISKYQEEFRRKQDMARELEISKQIDQRKQLLQTFVKMHRLKGWCAVPFEPIGGVSSPLTDNQLKKYYVNEEFDIDGGLEDYEKITVPDVDGLRSSRFIHDFNANKTGILDVERKRCYVMPLNRSQVLPPRDLIDLVQKMWQGYYEVDVHTVHETMRAVLPPVKDSSVGLYIQHECQGYPIYKLEKFVSGVFKRSVVAVTGSDMYKQFTGKQITEFEIMNQNEIDYFEKNSIST